MILISAIVVIVCSAFVLTAGLMSDSLDKHLDTFEKEDDDGIP